MLYLDCGDNKEVEIKVDPISGEPVIEEKPIVTTETWYLDKVPNGDMYREFIVNFISNSKQYDKLRVDFDEEEGEYYLNYGYNSQYDFAYSSFGGWRNQSYKTIVLSEPATGDLLTFLQANATKQ